MTDATLKDCIDTCTECHRTCLEHLTHMCLES